MEFGKLLGAKTIDNRVEIEFEKQDVVVQIITDEILRVLVPCWKKDYKSVAIEGNPSIPCDFQIEEDEGAVQIKTASVILNIWDDFGFVFTDKYKDEILTSYEGQRSLEGALSDEAVGLLEAEGHHLSGAKRVNYKIQQIFRLNEKERFYGMGDKTGFLNKRGFAYENWNSDIPQIHHENMPALYKSIPFVIGKGPGYTYGLFFDNTFHSYMDMGKESTDYFFYGADDGNLDMYFMTGECIADVIEHYTYLTGRSPLPQLWTLGYHQCRWGYASEDDIRTVAAKMRQNKIPCESIQYDIDYMDGYRVFTWNEKDYGPKGQLISDLKKDGFKAVCIIDPGVKVDEGYFMYDQGIKMDYFARDRDDKVYVNQVWPGDAVYPDFGREAVRNWWATSHKELVSLGMQGIWNDMNEPASFNGPLPLDVKFHIENRLTSHAEVHNVYGHFMSMATYQGMEEITGKRPLVITRACYAGTQKYAAVWTGDNQSVWSHLQMLIPQICNLGMSGFAIAGTDIGGFGGDTNPELLIRWVQAATFCTFFRNHCAKGQKLQEPWQFGETVVEIYRKYIELHYRFLPYIYDLLFESQITGLPVMRPLVLQYENDENTYNLNNQFMVGENMLVAPIVEQGMTKRMVYLPDGNWINYWTKERFSGKKHIIVDAPIDVLPIFIKVGSIIPMYHQVQYVGEKPYDSLKLLVAGDSAWGSHYQDNGEDFAYLDGEYNLYSFTYENGELDVDMLHEGYEKYKSIDIEMI